jgi:hypothetical protein
VNPKYVAVPEESMITGIGSFPFTDIDEAIDLIFSTCPDVPFWPQLPQRASYENMYTPFLTDVPCVKGDESSEGLYVDTEGTEGIERFYEDFFTGDASKFAVPERFIPGFYRFLERLPEVAAQATYIKTQITGPFSMGLGVKDREGKAIIYNASFYDMIKKALHMKARWMVSMIRSRFPGKDVIIFFDEPYLVSFGSAYVSVSQEETIGLLNEVAGGIDALRGVHCCGNTDWSVLFSADLDIVNYDAYNYLDTVFYYETHLKTFLKRGGRLAPGIVPSSAEVMGKGIDDMRAILKTFGGRMKDITGEATFAEPLITPSCGLGSLRPGEARRAMELLKGLDREDRNS